MSDCMEISPDGFLCTRDEGHGGVWHIAVIGYGISERWRIEEA